MFATPGRLPEGPQWQYEVHWAGLRVLVEITEGRLRLTSREGRDVTGHFPEFAHLAGQMRDGLLDAEIIILDGGVPSSAALARRVRGTDRRVRGTDRRRSSRLGERPGALLVSDVLRLYGVPLLNRSLRERRATLERVGVDSARHVALSPVYDDGPALLTATKRHCLPGVVAKRADSRYRPGVRDPAWIEVIHPRA
jgi:bifunctional non-homologous end joining protein LigD